ncbi:hypothetical protein GGTG_06843 [Gaeumannomyces tritici R3-111a-1]|uniref:Uncharacterized protein n=1 Tax=Gaeumannomyces tritici (strain R3-111a-1) TaxID=644352 RepID=J3NZZ6_GAET3|nr:hypothetical protein GGTG_06843 [Gaeumannomyces tritici R3-111a-1]EJT76929.1 hypothetical protein GGTG_06843 [Gaeumannomyces tritici R3-111a-1]
MPATHKNPSRVRAGQEKEVAQSQRHRGPPRQAWYGPRRVNFAKRLLAAASQHGGNLRDDVTRTVTVTCSALESKVHTLPSLPWADGYGTWFRLKGTEAHQPTGIEPRRQLAVGPEATKPPLLHFARSPCQKLKPAGPAAFGFAPPLDNIPRLAGGVRNKETWNGASPLLVSGASLCSGFLWG